MRVFEREWLTEDELKRLSSPKGQRAVMARRSSTGSRKKPVQHLSILYEDGYMEYTHIKEMLMIPRYQFILIRQEAAKRGFPTSERFQGVARNRCQRCQLPQRLCQCLSPVHPLPLRPSISEMP